MANACSQVGKVKQMQIGRVGQEADVTMGSRSHTAERTTWTRKKKENKHTSKIQPLMGSLLNEMMAETNPIATMKSKKMAIAPTIATRATRILPIKTR